MQETRSRSFISINLHYVQMFYQECVWIKLSLKMWGFVSILFLQTENKGTSSKRGKEDTNWSMWLGRKEKYKRNIYFSCLVCLLIKCCIYLAITIFMLFLLIGSNYFKVSYGWGRIMFYSFPNSILIFLKTKNVDAKFRFATYYYYCDSFFKLRCLQQRLNVFSVSVSLNPTIRDFDSWPL